MIHRLLLVDEQVDEQHQADADAEDDLGRERVVVDRRRDEAARGEQRREHPVTS